MHTGEDQQGIQAGQHTDTQEADVVVNGLHQPGNAIAQEDASRCHQTQGQGQHDKEGTQRHQHHAQDLRHILFEEALHIAHDEHDHDRGEHHIGIGSIIHRQAEDRHRGLAAQSSHQIGVHQQRTQAHGQAGVCTELFGGSIADEDGHEVQRSIGGITQHRVGGGICGQDTDEVCQHQHHLDQAGCHEQRDQRNDTAADSPADGAQAEFFLFAVVQIFVHSTLFLQAACSADGIVSLVHRLADDDLQLVTGPLCAHAAGQFADLVGIHKPLILHVEAQPGHAVCKRADVVLAADQFQNLRRNGFVFIDLLCHVCFLHDFTNGSTFSITNPAGARSRAALFQ